MFIKFVKVVCNGQKIDLKNDVWTVDGEHGTELRRGSLVKFNTTIGFRHQATGVNLHSHGAEFATTIKSKHQQGIFELMYS